MSSPIRNVCIIGAGPAGLAAAIVLARAEREVLVVDCATPPIDKGCGEGLLPDSIAALSRIGVEIPPEVGFPFQGVRFTDGRSSVSADFPNGVARGVRRTVLHELLMRHARRLNIPFLWGAKHVRLAEGGVSVDGSFLSAQLVVGADGQNSSIRRQAGLDPVRREKRRYGFRRHFRLPPWSSCMELYWGPRSQIYVTPIAADEVCVAVISRDPRLRLDHALSGFPELQMRLGSALPSSAEMGALSTSRTLKNVQHGNVVLIGDASGSVDAITGEGMCVAFKQALALAEAVRPGQMWRYQRLHRNLMRRPQAMASLMLMLERNSRLQRRVLSGLASFPELFEAFLALHVHASILKKAPAI